MRISTKGRFADNALVDLALRAPAGPVALASISQRQQIHCPGLNSCSAACAAWALWSTRVQGACRWRVSRKARAEIALPDESLEDAPSKATAMTLLQLWKRPAMLQHTATISLASLVQETVAWREG
jgi:Rrf2 family iron-sulfur cluster assembly transcriptional regulator